MDATATAMLIDVVKDAKARGIGLAVARSLVGHERLFLEVDDAVTVSGVAIPPAAVASDGGGQPGSPPSSAGVSAS